MQRSIVLFVRSSSTKTEFTSGQANREMKHVGGKATGIHHCKTNIMAAADESK